MRVRWSVSGASLVVAASLVVVSCGGSPPTAVPVAPTPTPVPTPAPTPLPSTAVVLTAENFDPVVLKARVPVLVYFHHPT